MKLTLIVMLLLIVLLLVALLGVYSFFYLQLKRRKKGGQVGKPQLKDDSSWGSCAKCQQWRIIVKKELGLCAACWSSIGTKSLS